MEKTKSYVGLFIIIPEKQDVIDEVKSKITTSITENSGSIVEENMIGKRDLAYPIKKKEEGVYLELTFSAEPASIAKIKRQCEINTDILRTLIDRNE